MNFLLFQNEQTQSVRKFKIHIFLIMKIKEWKNIEFFSHSNFNCISFKIMLYVFYRYIAICAPFFRLRHNIKAWYYMVPIVLFACIYNIPRFFELKCLLVTRYICSLNSTKEVEVEKWKYNYVMEHSNNTDLTKDINCWSETKYVLNTTEFRTNPLYIQVNKFILSFMIFLRNWSIEIQNKFMLFRIFLSFFALFYTIHILKVVCYSM